MGKRIGIY